MATPDVGEAFISRRWPNVRGIADPEQRIYRMMGLRRGSFRQLFGLKTIGRGIGAFFRGHGIGRPVGDPFQMPGFYLVSDGSVVKEYVSQQAGDHPDWLEFAQR